uniref:PWWP domain-containing protein n=1 Tax=Leersia perrieri TaxID=77586 RepID=A0A0D9WCU5_9ORYZ
MPPIPSLPHQPEGKNVQEFIRRPWHPKPKPKPRHPATKSRVSTLLRRMSDPTAAGSAVAAPSSVSGAIVLAGGGGAWPRGLRFGEMVWGKVKSHPWWPGHVYSLALTSDGEVRRGYREGLVLVAFFGDSSYGWFEPHELLPFEEHFREKAFQGGGRNFPLAIDEAIDEISRRASLACLCPCFQPAEAVRPHEADPRYLLVDVPGFDTDAEYHPEQVKAEREKIAPRAMLDYLRGAALDQVAAVDTLVGKNIPAVQMSSMLEAFRRSRYEQKDPTYAEAFGMDYEKAQAEKKALLKKARQGKRRVWWDRKTQEEPADIEDEPSNTTSAGKPTKGRKKAAENPAGGGRRGRKGGAAARLMEKIMPSAATMKPKAKKKDQYLLKRRDDARAPPPPSMPATDAVAAAATLAGGEPKKKKKKKKLAELNGVVAGASGSGSKAGSLPGKEVSDGLDLKQSYENDPPEDNSNSKNTSDAKPNTAATDGPKPKKKPAARPTGEPAAKVAAVAGVKRGPSDRQEELAVKKKAKLNKIKTMATDKKAAGLELAAASASAMPPAAATMQRKSDAIAAAAAKRKEVAAAAAPAMKTPSPTALMMKFPANSTLPSVASLKARFARFGPLDVDGIRVYWKSHMCRVIYKFKSDAEVALKYARSNTTMFGQVAPNYHLRTVESGGAGAGSEPAEAATPPSQQQRSSELRLMETAAFRPGSSGGNGAPLPMSRAAPAPARSAAVVGQPPKSILKKTIADDGAPSRDSPRVKFMLDAGDSKLDSPPPAAPANIGADAAVPLGRNAAKSVGFAAPPLQRAPARPALQPPRPPVTQPLPPPPPLHQPRRSDAPFPPFSAPPPPQQQLPPPPPPYHLRHSDGMQLPGPPPLPPSYQLRAGGGFAGQQPLQQPYSNNGASSSSSSSSEEMPAWKRGGKEFDDEVMRVMLRIAKLVEPLTDKNGNFPYHLFSKAS